MKSKYDLRLFFAVFVVVVLFFYTSFISYSFAVELILLQNFNTKWSLTLLVDSCCRKDRLKYAFLYHADGPTNCGKFSGALDGLDFPM